MSTKVTAKTQLLCVYHCQMMHPSIWYLLKDIANYLLLAACPTPPSPLLGSLLELHSTRCRTTLSNEHCLGDTASRLPTATMMSSILMSLALMLPDTLHPSDDPVISAWVTPCCCRKSSEKPPTAAWPSRFFRRRPIPPYHHPPSLVCHCHGE